MPLVAWEKIKKEKKVRKKILKMKANTVWSRNLKEIK